VREGGRVGGPAPAATAPEAPALTRSALTPSAPSRPGRALGIDLGERRIGVAASDSGQILASPLTVLQRSGNVARDHGAIARIVEEHGAVVVVVGLPVSLSGRAGRAAEKALAETAELAEALEVPVVSWDERLTTVEATRRLRESSVGAPRRPTAKKRPVVDDLAAVVLLQAWLDRSAAAGGRAR
jgi:putative holliday junction resolvase